MKPCASQSLPLFSLSMLGVSCSVWTPASLPLLRSSGLSFSAESNASALAEEAHPKGELRAASSFHPQGSSRDWMQARHCPAKPGGLALTLLAKMELVADPARAMAAAVAATAGPGAQAAGASHLQGQQLRCLQHSDHQAEQGLEEAAKSLEASDMILLSRTPIHHFLDRTEPPSQLPWALGGGNPLKGNGEEQFVREHHSDDDDDSAGGNVDGSSCSTSASRRLKAMAWAKTVRGAVKVVEGNRWEDEEAIGELEHLKRRRKRFQKLEAAMAASAKRAAARKAVAGGAAALTMPSERGGAQDSGVAPPSFAHPTSLDPTTLARIELNADLIRGRAKTCQGRLSHSLSLSASRTQTLGAPSILSGGAAEYSDLRRDLPRGGSLRHSDQVNLEETSTSDLAPQLINERYMVLNIEGALRAFQQQVTEGGSSRGGEEGFGDMPSTWRTDPSSARHRRTVGHETRSAQTGSGAVGRRPLQIQHTMPSFRNGTGRSLVPKPASGTAQPIKPSATAPMAMPAAASLTQWWGWGATAIWKLASAMRQRFEQQHEEQHRAGTALVSVWHEAGSK